MILNSFTYLYPERPTLLSLQRNRVLIKGLDPKTWRAEKKYNGTRCILHILDGEISFWGRHGEKLAYTPSAELLEAIKKMNLKGYWIFDGELRHNKTKGISNKLVLWDVLCADSILLFEPPYWVRRSILDDFLTREAEPLGSTYQMQGDWEEIFNQVIKGDDEAEGIVLKNLRGVLRLGRSSAFDSTWMLKIRKTKAQGQGRWQF